MSAMNPILRLPMFRLPMIAIACLASAGCASDWTNSSQHAVPVEQRFPIAVEPSMLTVRLRIDEGMQGLAKGEHARVIWAAERWQQRGRGQITVAGPQGSPNQRAGEEAMKQAVRKLQESGVPRSAITLAAYPGHEGGEEPPVTLSFVTLVAVGPDCGKDWSENLAFTPANTPWPDFGCATQRNLAAAVSDPRDLIEPKPMDSADAARRGKVLNTYRQGTATQTSRKADESGKVSTVDGGGGSGSGGQ